jgi:hypothetical protein
MYPWGFYAHVNYSLVKKFNFKLQFKPIRRIEMCCLLFGCSNYMTKKGVININLWMVFLHFASIWETNHKKYWG